MILCKGNIVLAKLVVFEPGAQEVEAAWGENRLCRKGRVNGKRK